MLISDYHIHSNFSGDSKESLENIVIKAKKLNLREIAITDHVDFDIKNKEKNHTLKDLDRYIFTLQNLKEKYKGKLDIKIGMEFGIQSHLKDRALEVSRKYPFDFVISSIHAIDEVLLNEKEFWEDKNIEEVYDIYFNELLNCLKIYDNFSVLGHIDYISRYAVPRKSIDYNRYNDIFEKIFKFLIEKEKGIEINTSGIKYSEDRFYPSNLLIKKYFDMGGEIYTIGSDAHRADEICSKFEQVENFLRSIGVKYRCSFDKMKVKFENL